MKVYVVLFESPTKGHFKGILSTNGYAENFINELTNTNIQDGKWSISE